MQTINFEYLFGHGMTLMVPVYMPIPQVKARGPVWVGVKVTWVVPVGGKFLVMPCVGIEKIEVQEKLPEVCKLRVTGWPILTANLLGE